MLNAVFGFIEVASAPIHPLLEFFFTSTSHNILSKPLAFSHITNVIKAVVCSEEGMNPVGMPIINPQTKIGRARGTK